MFKKIVVPLDGTEQAERALSVAARIARVACSTIVLLCVAPISKRSTVLATISGEQASLRATQDIDQGEEYLERIAMTRDLEGIPVEQHFLHGTDIAECLLSSVQSMGADLMILFSHGKTAFHRQSGVAQSLIRHSLIPLFILHEGWVEQTNIHPTGRCSTRILVALDGSVLAENVLGMAARLSVALSTPSPGVLHLVRVVPLLSLEESMRQSGAVDVRALAYMEAQEYLERVIRRLHCCDMAHLNLTLTSSVIIHADIARTLVNVAEAVGQQEQMSGFNESDIIALTTHARQGVQRWVLGSVAEQVLNSTKLPLLIMS